MSAMRFELAFEAARACCIIAVVINMFRLPDSLTKENVMCNSLKLLQT
jgi:hypothetical protein